MHKSEIEKAYIEALINSPQGRWLIRELINKSSCFVIPNRSTPTQDAYFAGKRDFIFNEVVKRVVDEFGWTVIDKIMEKSYVSTTIGSANGASSQHAGAGTAGAGTAVTGGTATIPAPRPAGK